MVISGTKIIITGGASGIGRAFARSLGEAGATCWVLDKDLPEDRLTNCEYLKCDISDEHQVTKVVADIDSESGGIDVLVNNAAILRDQVLVGRLGKRVKKHDSADWHDTLGTNLTGTFLMARETCHSMICRKKAGVIVNISSISAAGNAGQSAYAASKAAVSALTVTWAKELANYKIRVAGIAPGFVETGMTKNIPPMFLSQIRNLSPLKRFGTLEEFGHAIKYVIENDYFHGKTLELDGGIRF